MVIIDNVIRLQKTIDRNWKLYESLKLRVCDNLVDMKLRSIFGTFIWISLVEREDLPDIKISEGRIYNRHRLITRQGKTFRAKCHCSRIDE